VGGFPAGREIGREFSLFRAVSIRFHVKSCLDSNAFVQIPCLSGAGKLSRAGWELAGPAQGICQLDREGRNGGSKSYVVKARARQA
jgi:hypothetical protein